MQYDVMRKLLPRGIALGQEALKVHRLVKCLSHEFDRIFNLSEKAFLEVPGHLDERLSEWERLLNIKASEDSGKDIAARLASFGGQSHSYLLSILKKHASSQENVELVSSRGQHYLEVKGVKIITSYMDAVSPIDQAIEKRERNESLIEGFEMIKHAEVEARYYPHGQD